MDNWFTDDLKDADRYWKFREMPAEHQMDEYYKASVKRAKKQAGADIYATDPLMSGYHQLSRYGKRVFDVNNNCYAWASGSTTNGFNRLTLPRGDALCPQPGDSMGIPFLYLNGHPSSVFGHMSMVRALCQIDQLAPLRLPKGADLPETPDQRLVGIVLYHNKEGKQDYHCTVRAAGAKHFSSKPGTKPPPSMLDDNGNVYTDPRKACFGKQVSHWSLFTLPAGGAAFQVNPQIRELAQQVVKEGGAMAQRERAMATLAEIAQERSQRFAQKLLNP